MSLLYEYDGWSFDRLRSQRNRAHFLLTDPYRYVSVILTTKPSEGNRLYCIDSPCYHAAGPLAEGDVLEIEDMLCVRCPWHHFLVDLETGREILLEENATTADGLVHRHPVKPTKHPLKPIDPADPGIMVVRGTVVQRVHQATIDESTGVLSIIIDEESIQQHKVRSDKSAMSVKDGAMCMQIFDIKRIGL